MDSPSSIGKLLILAIGSLCLSYTLIALLKLFYNYWWIPHRIQSILNSQGIKGPPYQFIYGNNKDIMEMKRKASTKPLPLTHDIVPWVLPHVHSWIKTYGKNYLFWNGIRAELVITEPEIIKEVLKNSEKAFPKRKVSYFIGKILGDGLAITVKEKWVRQRKLANYAFHGESLKNMTPAVIASVETMLEKWKGQEGKEIEVSKEFRLLSSEVISRTAFGSSYLEGEKIFETLTKLAVIVARNTYKARIPVISHFWKSADEIESEKLEKEIYGSVIEMVKKREERVESGEADNFGNDFLGMLLNAHHDSDEEKRLSIEDLVDECKTFYFAGHDTTKSLLNWTALLLAIHTDWQEKARAEVIEVFGNQNPHSEGIAKLKTMSMIIYETLRLYPPVNGLIRKVGREVQLGKLVLPTYIEFNIPNMAVHRDPELWGDDVHDFKPERFSEGIANATNYNAAAYVPFGLGPRSCVGMSFAITETKTMLSMILQRYAFTLSPAYVHSPLYRLALEPQHGIQLLFHSLHTTA